MWRAALVILLVSSNTVARAENLPIQYVQSDTRLLAEARIDSASVLDLECGAPVTIVESVGGAPFALVVAEGMQGFAQVQFWRQTGRRYARNPLSTQH